MTIKLMLLGIFLVPLTGYAQEKKPETLPDTLVIEIKPSQKVILIGNDLESFQNVKIDSIVGKALHQVKDSLATSQIEPKTTDSLPRTRFINRFELGLPLGAALIRNTLVPTLFLELEYAPKKIKYYSKKDPWYSFFKLGIESYYFFDRDENKQFNRFFNSYISLVIGNKYNTDVRPDFKMKMYGTGIGFQARKSEGGYFDGYTFKSIAFVQPARIPLIFRSEIYIKEKALFPSISILYNFKN